MSKLEIPSGKVNQGRPPQRYIRETVRRAEATSVVERIAASAELLPEPRPTINYILGGPIDNQY